MTITTLEEAITLAKDRVRRGNAAICIVQIDNNQYVLWREDTIAGLILVYDRYNIVYTVRKQTYDTK